MGEKEKRLGRYPYLGLDYAFLEKVLGAVPFLKNSLFWYWCMDEFWYERRLYQCGVCGGSKTCCRSGGLFAAELELHWKGLQAHDTSQVKLSD